MSRDQWFDALARDSAQGLSRRQVFARLLGGGAVAVFSLFGMRQADSGGTKKDCGKLCEECCTNAYPDSRYSHDGRDGRDFAECVQDCKRGGGLCGPIVCPDGSSE
jgi:hypothetical protein